MNPTKTKAIKTFLTKKAPADLAALYNEGMEVQVNVTKGDGERCEGEYQGRTYSFYSDGVEKWKSFRIPVGANSNPIFEDSVLSFDLAKHVESIGMTGWDFVNRQSRWVAFDFDAILGHAESHTQGLSSEELRSIKQKAEELPYVTIRRSTSGSGIHLYVFFKEPIPTENHNDHAALGRAVLAQMSYEIGFDFKEHVDVQASNMWVWHKKYEASGGLGLALIREGEPLESAPENWEIHKSTNRRFKLVSEADEDYDSMIEYSKGQRRYPLDAEHKKIIEALKSENNFLTYWDADQHCLKTHTKALEIVHDNLKLNGVFKTATSSSTTHNCYAYPGPKGSFKVFRFGSSTAEAETWSLSEDGNRYCNYNSGISTNIAAIVSKGIENVKGGFDFKTADDLKSAAQKLKVDVNIPENFNDRKSTIEDLSDGRLLVKIQKQKGDVVPDSWGEDKNSICKIYPKPNNTDTDDGDLAQIDKTLRYIIGTDGKEAGWAYKGSEVVKWQFPKNTLGMRLGLKERGYKNEEVDSLMGKSFNNPWTYVNKPFKPEYPGNREWNDGAAQLAYAITDKENLDYRTWMRILNHVGEGLNDAVAADLFCQEQGINTGGDYLKLWVAYMFQRPYARLPFLYFYSTEQGTGKSTFHEALSMLFAGKEGSVSADLALREQYNGQLANAILCTIEETNLSKNAAIYNKVKELTTAKFISIRAMYKPQTEVRNSTHWVQCANSLDYVPIEPGDTRIVVSRVNVLVDPILPAQLDAKLKSEASDFITAIMRVELPSLSCGRLNLPVLLTEEKARAMTNKENSLDDFIRTCCAPCKGNMMVFSTFYDKFNAFLDPEERVLWNRTNVKKKIPQDLYPVGRRSNDSVMCIGNIAMLDSGDKPKAKPVVMDANNGRLKTK
jgi:hypothetical protein